MSLILKASDNSTDDYRVKHGELEVGQIYKRKAAIRPEAQWLWALNGVPSGAQALGITGLAPTLDKAFAELAEAWSKWLTSSELAEVPNGLV